MNWLRSIFALGLGFCFVASTAAADEGASSALTALKGAKQQVEVYIGSTPSAGLLNGLLELSDADLAISVLVSPSVDHAVGYRATLVEVFAEFAGDPPTICVLNEDAGNEILVIGDTLQYRDDYDPNAAFAFRRAQDGDWVTLTEPAFTDAVQTLEALSGNCQLY